MLKLASDAIGEVYTISLQDWTAINKRVGCVLAEQTIESDVEQMLPGYADLLSKSLLWQSDTFKGLVEQAAALADYTGKAIQNFSTLQDAINQNIKTGGPATEALKIQTKATLATLAADTKPLSSSFNILSSQVMDFLIANSAVDAQIAADEANLGSFFEPLGATINNVNQAIGLVTGAWGILSDDLALTLASPIDPTMAFLESLNIGAAIICWQNLQKEASGFSGLVSGQQQYWTNPFQN